MKRGWRRVRGLLLPPTVMGESEPADLPGNGDRHRPTKPGRSRGRPPVLVSKRTSQVIPLDQNRRARGDPRWSTPRSPNPHRVSVLPPLPFGNNRRRAPPHMPPGT